MTDHTYAVEILTVELHAIETEMKKMKTRVADIESEHDYYHRRRLDVMNAIDKLSDKNTCLIEHKDIVLPNGSHREYWTCLTHDITSRYYYDNNAEGYAHALNAHLTEHNADMVPWTGPNGSDTASGD